MAKRIVVCCDGTWNTPDELRHGQASPTNVCKVALAVADRGTDGTNQVTYYHSGVGTTRSDKFTGGAFGAGLSRDVMSAYRYVVATYEPGDQLFLFGFSRGAFTARSAAGFIRNCGILRREHADRLDDAYALYRSHNDATKPRGIESTLFRQAYSHEASVYFIGVWDTVGSLGIPLSGNPLINLINKRWQFHDTALSSTVSFAYQALAIDEQRRPFEPTLWTQPQDAPNQKLEQVWFSGVHCDVGGGYFTHELSDVTLSWMTDNARKCGLHFKPEAFAVHPPVPPASADTVPIVDAYTSIQPNPLGQKHNSMTPMYRLLGRYIRHIGEIDPEHEYVSSTAWTRTERDSTYHPKPLEVPPKGGFHTMPVDQIMSADVA
jgi:uncharacterized protein (DUF2235 family)